MRAIYGQEGADNLVQEFEEGIVVHDDPALPRAAVGVDRNEMPLIVLSALARLCRSLEGSVWTVRGAEGHGQAEIGFFHSAIAGQSSGCRQIAA